jgi:ribosomal protein L37E
MSDVKRVMKDNIEEIISDLNEELFLDRIIRYWKKKGSHRTLNEHRTTYWDDDSGAEFGVDIGVSFGKIFELYLPEKLKELGCDVEPKFSSSGDMIAGDTHWELKTGQGGYIQGATHSPKEHKSMNLIQVLWTPHKNKSLDDILADRKFISELNISVFEDIKVDSQGTASNNNSRTSMRIGRHMFKESVSACIYGAVKKNRKYVGFTKVGV